jgi:hypothetical protein
MAAPAVMAVIVITPFFIPTVVTAFVPIFIAVPYYPLARAATVTRILVYIIGII